MTVLRLNDPLAAAGGLDEPHAQLVQDLFEHLTLFGRQVAARLLLEQRRGSRSSAPRLRDSTSAGWPDIGIGQIAEMNRGGAGQREHERGEGQERLGAFELRLPNVRVEPRRRSSPASSRSWRRCARPDGCPWDREQTIDTLKPFVLEETYEVLEAIDRARPRGAARGARRLRVRGGLPRAARSRGRTLHDRRLAERIADKLVRRHPHVFARDDGEAPLDSAERVRHAVGGDQGAGARRRAPSRRRC